jgi:hypothetical protein
MNIFVIFFLFLKKKQRRDLVYGMEGGWCHVHMNPTEGPYMIIQIHCMILKDRTHLSATLTDVRIRIFV